jgi:hypothetical protein
MISGLLLRAHGLRFANLFYGPVDDRLQFSRVLDFATFGQGFLGFVGAKPGGIAHHLRGIFFPLYLEQEGFDHKLLHSRRFPEDAFRVQVKAKVARFDAAANPSFFPGFAFRGLSMRQGQFGVAFGKRPLVSAVRVHQQEFDGGTSPAVANGGYLQGKRVSWIPCRTHFFLSEVFFLACLSKRPSSAELRHAGDASPDANSNVNPKIFQEC